MDYRAVIVGLWPVGFIVIGIAFYYSNWKFVAAHRAHYGTWDPWAQVYGLVGPLEATRQAWRVYFKRLDDPTVERLRKRTILLWLVGGVWVVGGFVVLASLMVLGVFGSN